MKTQISILSLLRICLLSSIQFVSSESEQFTYIRGACSISENVAINSTYSKNIVSLLSNLTSLSSNFKFSNFSDGSGPDQVNGLYLCRPDLPPKTCHACVNTVVNDLLTRCTNKKEAILWYDKCMVRYSNRSIFSTEEIQPVRQSFSALNVSQPEIFSTLLNRTMEGLIAEAISPNNNQRFATGNASFTVFEGLYGMVLCTPDITREECQHCLRTALGVIPSCCGGLSQWVMVALPSCQLRYDIAPFIFPPSPPLFAPAPAPALPSSA